MANTNIGISNFVQSQSPFFVRNDHPNFIRFVEAYYEYMEQEGKTIQRAKGFKEALDVDRSIDLYTEKLYSQFLKFIPEETIADKNLIIKHIKDFYRARGTEKSVEFLMAILYDEDVNFYYPKRDILKASDGKWYQEKSLKVFDVQVNNVADPGIYTIKNLAGRQIRGETSNATATVESADVYYENGVIVKELKVSNQVRDFRAGEKVRGQFEEEGLIKDLSANVFSGIIVRVDIKNRGNNYSVGQIANVESNVGSGAVIAISEVSRASIKSISAFDGGAGFQNTNLILITGSSGSGANAYVSLINADESIHPNTYNIVASLLGATANDLIGNTSNPYETFSYANLSPVLITVAPNTSNLTANTISGTSVGRLYFNQHIANSNVYFKTGDSLNVFNVLSNTSYVLYISSNTVNTTNIQFTPQISGNLFFERVTILTAPFSAYSNLTISTGSGASVNTINLSFWKSNSNVFFETYDNIYCFGTNVRITKSNTITSELTISPGLSGNLVNEPFQVIKKPNAYTTLANSMIYFTYANTGPISRVVVLAGGNNYTGNTTLTAVANTRVRNLGVLGKMRIVSGGLGYALGEEIEIINQPWSPGVGASASMGYGARGYIASVNAGGTIESVKFKEVPGYIIGGTGYSQSRLPTANIISNTGVGGNVIVTAVLGDGEALTTVTDDLGAILKLDIISGGSGYVNPPTINLKAIGSGTAQAVATIVEGVYTYPGRYLNDDGHLSSFNFLQDGRYYHNYSYVVRIKQSISKYRKALKDLVHPAGMSLFGEYTTVDNGETMNVQVSTANQTAKYIYYDDRSYRMANLTSNTDGQFVINMNTADQTPNSQLYIEFNSGNVTTLNANGYYYVKSVINANALVVYAGTKLPASMNVALQGENGPWDLYFRDDGKILYTIGWSLNRVVRYDLIYPWDISSTVYRTTGIDIGDTNPQAIYVRPDGNSYYTLGAAGKTVRQFSVNVGNSWNVNTSTFVTSYNVSAQESNPTALSFSNNGTYMYVGGAANDRINMYTLSTAWNVDTAIYTSNLSISANEAIVHGMYFKNDGTQLYIVGSGSGRIHQYKLNTAWNVATATYNTRSQLVTTLDSNPFGISFNDIGTLVYIVGYTNRTVYQLPLTEAWNAATVKVETFANTGNSGLAMVAKQVT